MIFDPQQQAFLYTSVRHKDKTLSQTSEAHYEWAQKFKKALSKILISNLIEFIEEQKGIASPGTAIWAHWDSVTQPIDDPTTLTRPPRTLMDSPRTYSQKGPDHASPEVTSLKYDPTKVAAPNPNLRSSQAAAPSTRFPQLPHSDFLDGPRDAPPPPEQPPQSWNPESFQPAASSGGQRRPAKNPYQVARRSDSPQPEKSPASRERNYRQRSPRREIQRSPSSDPPFPIMPNIPDHLSEEGLSEDEKLRRRRVANRVHIIWEEAWSGHTLNILLEGEPRRENVTESERASDGGRLANAQRRIDEIYKEDEIETRKYEDKKKKEREQLESGGQTHRHVQERNRPSGQEQRSGKGEQRRTTEKERLIQKPPQEQKRTGGGRKRH